MMALDRTRVVLAASSAVVIVGGATYAAFQAVGESASSNWGTAGVAMMSERGTGMGTGMGRFTEDQPFDAQFLDQMTVHHEGAIMSTTAMIADSDRRELRTLAEDILISQRKQISVMRAWRAQWYPDLDLTFGMGGSMAGESDDESMSGGMMRDSMMEGTERGDSAAESMMDGTMMESMMGGAAGTERMYLQMMIVHHQLAVDMAEQAQRRATHPQLKELAAVIAEEQAAQITEMRGILASAGD